MSSVTPITESLTLSLQTPLEISSEENNGDDDDDERRMIASLQERLDSLQQQVRQLSVTESRRLYELLQAQRVAIEEEQEIELQKVVEAVREEERAKMQERVTERVDRIKERYYNGIERMTVGEMNGENCVVEEELVT